MNKKGRACRQAGFTLIEIIIAMVVTGVIFTVFALIINTAMQSWAFMRDQKSVAAEARSAMQRMVREIRRTRDGSGITTLEAADYGFVDVDGGNIEYAQSGTDLQRNGVVMLENLDTGGLSFVYLDGSGVETTVEGEVRCVRISLVAEDGGNRVRLRASAGIRNR
jgi:prepilin-type N-terminal cleavage/methylation domain-containing protein